MYPTVDAQLPAAERISGVPPRLRKLPAPLGQLGQIERAMRLRSDLRLELFGALFGLGCILHEVKFILEQQQTAPLFEFMERWGQVRPSSGLSSQAALTIHFLVVVASLALIALPRRRAPLAI